MLLTFEEDYCIMITVININKEDQMPTLKRHTIQKTLTYKAVCELANHPSAEEIYDKVRRQCPSISLGTVYRNLGTLCEDGLLLHIKLPGAADRYDHNVTSHRHCSCSICGKVCDIMIPYDSATDEQAQTQTGFFNITHDTIFTGICPACHRAGAKKTEMK